MYICLNQIIWTTVLIPLQLLLVWPWSWRVWLQWCARHSSRWSHLYTWRWIVYSLVTESTDVLLNFFDKFRAYLAVNLSDSLKCSGHTSCIFRSSTKGESFDNLTLLLLISYHHVIFGFLNFSLVFNPNLVIM